MLAKAAELQRQGRDIINLGIGQPDFKTPPHIVEAAVRDGTRDGERGYTDATGIAPLREAVAEDLHRRLGVEVSPDLVLIVPGGKVTMFMAIMMFGGKGVDVLFLQYRLPHLSLDDRIHRRAAVPPPDARGERLRLLGRGGAESSSTPQDAARHPELARQSDRRGDPWGGIDKLVAGLARWPNAAILSDEIYGQLTYDGLAHRSLLAYPEIRDRLILLDGWSKTYAMTGWRLGYSRLAKAAGATSRASSRSIPIPASMRRRNSPGSRR